MTFSSEWHALNREAAIAAEQLARGVTALGKANHAHIGRYGEAFFALSIGFERLAKLIVIADHAISHNGQFPDNGDLKNIGHDISALIDACEAISNRVRPVGDFAERPNDPVHKGIIETLNEFAKQTRYYNLDLLSGGKRASQSEPVSAWWERVGKPVLAKHYSSRQKQKDVNEAACMEVLLGNNILVRHFRENRVGIESVEEMLLHSGKTRVVQKYGRLYTMQLIRWLSCLIDDLSYKGAYQSRTKALSGINEPFKIFYNEDCYFLKRKTWSIYRL